MSDVAVITGGAGFIGRHLARRLLRRGDQVRIVDSARPPDDLVAGWHATDIRNFADVAGVARGATVVCHLASTVGVEAVLGDPLECIDVIVNGTRSAVQAAASAGARLVHLSSSEVLGANPAVPWSEDADRVLGPPDVDRWSYAAAKSTAEHIVLAGARSRNVEASIVRPFNVYGPEQDARFVIPMMIRSALDRGYIEVYGDGTQTRCFTYIDDLVDAVVAVGDNAGLRPVFHVGGSDEIAMSALAVHVFAACGVDGVARLVEHPGSRRGWFQEIPRRLPDTTAARDLLGWYLRTPLGPGLAQTVAWERSRRTVR